jgi:hypothetical protein
VKVDFDARLWIWEARRDESWTFVTLPVDESEAIRELAGGVTRGWGSLRVRVRVGVTTWTTSIFPDAKRDAYVLPIKKAVRRAEALESGSLARVTVELIDL